MRIAVTGGRDYADVDAVAAALVALRSDATLVHGAARGLDTMAASLWGSWGRALDPFPADWHGPCDPTFCRHAARDGGYCPAAGPRRNAAMVASGLHLLIAWPGGDGTWDMTERCADAGVRVLLHAPAYLIRETAADRPT